MAKIIIIDDDEFFLHALSVFFKDNGFDVIEMQNGCYLEKIIRQETPDLIITDILMPDCDGLEVIGEIKKKHFNIPVIAMSGGGRVNQDYYLEMAQALGVAAILEKPFKLEQVLGIVTDIIAT